MEFISAEDFLKQSDKVQKVFLEWWKPNDGDIYWWNEEKYIDCCYSWKFIDNTDANNLKYKEITPLLTEGQLRKFIEDKTEYRVDYCLYEGTYDINICENNGLYIKKYEDIDKDLLQAYWKVAIQIAENL